MANGKKSFILYSDQVGIFKELTDKEAGVLIKHILLYVNDENPVLENKLLKIAFEPIRLQLKRDLKDWEEKRKERSESGKKGMEKRWGNTEIITKDSSAINHITKITVTDNVTVNDTVIDNINKNHDLVCYDAEEFILNNQLVFEKICIATGKTSDEFKTYLHAYHLWMTKNEKYPIGKRAVTAGAESWILNEKNFKSSLNVQKQIIKNGTAITTGSKTRIDKQQQSISSLIEIGENEYAAAIREKTA